LIAGRFESTSKAGKGIWSATVEDSEAFEQKEGETRGFSYVYSPERIRVSGLAVRASQGVRDALDALASEVARALGTPVALVCVVEDGRQCFVGQFGLQPPWSQKRETPLSHSFCQHAVAEKGPLVIDDARLDWRVWSNLAIPDLGVLAYLGVPIRLSGGEVIGSLCAISDTARSWSKAELRRLEAFCGTAAELLEREIQRLAQAPPNGDMA